jgi:hypothetical protein
MLTTNRNSFCAEIEMGILGIIEFVFVLLMGGCIALGIVLLCIHLSLSASGEW